MMEVPAEDFTTDRLPDGAQPYTGRAEVYISDSLLTAFKKKGAPAEELYTVDGAGERKPVSLTENQFVLLRSDTEPKKTMLGRFHEERVTALRFGGVRPFGVKPGAWASNLCRRPCCCRRRRRPWPSSKGRRAPPRLLRPGCRAGAGAGGGGTALSEDSGVPPQCPV